MDENDTKENIGNYASKKSQGRLTLLVDNKKKTIMETLT